MIVRASANPHYRVWLDGIEVTAECQIAIADEPDEAGAVLLLKRNADGHHYRDPATHEVAREWQYGRVVIRPDSPSGRGVSKLGEPPPGEGRLPVTA